MQAVCVALGLGWENPPPPTPKTPNANTLSNGNAKARKVQGYCFFKVTNAQIFFSLAVGQRRYNPIIYACFVWAFSFSSLLLVWACTPSVQECGCVLADCQKVGMKIFSYIKKSFNLPNSRKIFHILALRLWTISVWVC